MMFSMTSFSRRKCWFPFLFPFSLLYGIIVSIRNKLFDLHILRSIEFDLPVISVGNITVGGTGKTPHVEYLLTLLSRQFHVAVLSRGYKRKTKGFILAGEGSSPEEIGDESYQMKLKFNQVLVAVDENRVHGIDMLKQKAEKLRCVILDDAYQHRHVRPGLSILLVNFYRPLHKDHILPLGDLRESRCGINRADIVIITKVPRDIKPGEAQDWIKDMNITPHQCLYFTTFQYGSIIRVFDGENKLRNLIDFDRKTLQILLLTGIANNEPLYRELSKYCNSIQVLKYSDHHAYSMADLRAVHKLFRNLQGKNKLVITTEKDAVKIRKIDTIDFELKESMYYLPIQVKFVDDKQVEFEQHILDYVAKNKRVGRFHS